MFNVYVVYVLRHYNEWKSMFVYYDVYTQYLSSLAGIMYRSLSNTNIQLLVFGL